MNRVTDHTRTEKIGGDSILFLVVSLSRGGKPLRHHLIGHNFLVESDMSAFSQMLNLKKKTIANARVCVQRDD